MRFDKIIGNPPYQSPNSEASKLYNLITKKVIRMLKDQGEISFLTPQAIAQPLGLLSKFYKNNVEYIDYTADKYFSVGVYVVEWKVTAKRHQKIKITNKDGTVDYRNPNDGYFLIDKYEIDPRKYVDRLIEINGKNPLTINNSPNPSETNEDDFEKCRFNKFAVIKNAKTCDIFHTNIEPNNHRKRKLSIQRSMMLSEESMWDDNKDYGGLMTEVEIKNLKSFILSPPFKAIQMMSKSIRMTGFSNLLCAWNTSDFTFKRTDDEILDLLCINQLERDILKKYYVNVKT